MHISRPLAVIIIFICIGFGLLNLIPSGLKIMPRLISITIVAMCLVGFLITKHRVRVLDYILLLLCLISSIGFANFLIDICWRPSITAIDCEGHHSVPMTWVKGFVLGFLVTFITGFKYLTDKTENKRITKTMAGCCLVILIISLLPFDFVLQINAYIHEVSIPVIVLPVNC